MKRINLIVGAAALLLPELLLQMINGIWVLTVGYYDLGQ